MPQLNGTGPDGKGAGTGRKLGKCSESTADDKLKSLGKGLGKKHHSGGGKGKGKRLKSGLI